MVSQFQASDTLVFHDPTYPQVCTEATLHKLVPGPFETTDARHLVERLEAGCDTLVSFHGPYFPKAAWNTILRFLESGGNIALFGGVPFALPVEEDGTIEPEQDAYTRQLYLGPFFKVNPDSSASPALRLVADDDALFLCDCPLTLSAGQPGTFWALYPKLTQISDHPEELGSAGPFNTVLQPLIYAVAPTDSGGEKVATPALVLDQCSGRFEGGRWLISAWEPASEGDWLANEQAILRLISLAAGGAINFSVRPTLGCYRADEAPALLVTAPCTVEMHAHITIYPPESHEILREFEIDTPVSFVPYEMYLQLSPQNRPGLYRVQVEYQPSDGQAMAMETGFWVWDESLIEATRGKRLVAGRDYFYQGEQVFPVCGTTYMDSRVQRKYLHLPNPARWDKDMAEMKTEGINLLRTGIWTGWRDFVPAAGVADEAFLRSLDAFVMTVCKHNLQLIFTFFAFFPLLFEGVNPWLDPRSVQGQQKFVALLARRYARVELLSWDLINEPSFGDPAKIFAQRPLPNYDHFEVAAFRTWLQERYSLEQLQLRWRKTPADMPDWEHVGLPRETDYSTNIRDTTARAMLQVADYTRFSQDMFTTWARQMVKAIREADSQTLIGVGQDESGARISPQFYALAVDYTTTHPWWNIDDLLWDMLLDKTPDRPNLIQETGVMLARDIDGHPWRSESENAHLLERKLITGLIANGAGLVQWLWHTNAYMTSDNENSIGLVRADGSAKPELAIVKEFGRLMQALTGQLLEAPTPSTVWVAIPYSQWFARPELGYRGTKRAIRALGYGCGVIPQMVGEQQLTTLTTLLTMSHRPRLLIVPALQFIDKAVWHALLQYVNGGGTLLVSGVISRDAHNLPFDPLIEGTYSKLAPVPVSHFEELQDADGQTYTLMFAEEKIGYVKKAHNQLIRYSYGAGTLFWCGLPLELASEPSAIETIYQKILRHANCSTTPVQKPLLIARKPLKDGKLILAISESSSVQHFALDEHTQVTIAPNRAGAMILLDGQMPQTFGGIFREKGEEAVWEPDIHKGSPYMLPGNM